MKRFPSSRCASTIQIVRPSMLRCEQVISAGDEWSSCRADKNVVVHVPNGGLTRARIIKQNIGAAVMVEIGRSRKEKAPPMTWGNSNNVRNIVVNIKDLVLDPADARDQQPIRVSISVKIR